MVERRRFGNVIPHLILLTGVAVVAFPVYLCFVGSTLPQATIANGQMGLMPGPLFFDTYWRTLFVGTSGTTREPVATMLLNSLVMATGIAVGKIAISIITSYAVVYFKFPFRMAAFWMIFITLMLPVEVRIYPTYKIAADLSLLNSYAGL
ncbi:MAG: glycerol-3-phosphate transporter, partial [Hyphomicrobiaceae bacterium]